MTRSVRNDDAKFGMKRTLALRLSVGAALALSVIGVSIQLGSADVEIEDQKLQAFIKAALAVDNVMDKWQPKIIQAGDSAQSESLHVKANEEIRAAIERADGISFDEYQTIRKAIAADPEMLDRVTSLMWRKRGE